jgi:hypothetical protein
MSVRVCYVERDERGNSIRRVRLIGQGTQSALETQAGQARVDPKVAAEWIAKELAGTRDSRAVTMLCLDTDGAVCCWLSSPSTDPAVLNIVARSAGAGGTEEASRGVTPIDYYAPGMMEASIEPLGTAVARPPVQRKRLFKSKQSAATADQPVSSRLAILAMSDVPGRLLVDALDKQSVPVETAASLWHAMAIAWDPAWKAPSVMEAAEDPLAPRTRPLVCATALVDPTGKLLWCWSKAGSLLVAGSMRLRAVSNEQNISDGSGVEGSGDVSRGVGGAVTYVLGEEEVARLTTEWIGWAAQVGCAPQHITLCMCEGTQGDVAQFGQLLGKALPGTPIDAGFHGDPVGATLERVAQRLEQTPTGQGVSGGSALVGLATRRGRAHRTYYFWTAAAIGGAAAIAAAAGFQFRSMADQARKRAADVAIESGELVAEHFPTASAGPGYSLLQATTEEVRKLRSLAEPAKRELPFPLLEELASVAMIVGSGNYALESIELESSLNAQSKMTVLATSLADEEALNEALRSISGLHVVGWIPGATSANQPRSPSGQYKVNYTAQWLPVKPKAEAPAAPAATASTPGAGGAT